MKHGWPYYVFRSIALVIGVGILTALSLRASGAAGGPEALKGKAAPDFTLSTVADRQVKLSELKGQVVVVDFWATWCPPCLASLPHIQKLSVDPGLKQRGLIVLAINAEEAKEKIESFLESNKYTFAVPMDADGKVQHDYNLDGIPTTLVVGRDGNVLAVFVGFNAKDGGKSIDDAVEAALNEKTKNGGLNP